MFTWQRGLYGMGLQFSDGVFVACVWYIQICLCRGQRLMLDGFLYCSLPRVLRQGLSPNLEITISTRPSSQQAIGVSLPPSSRVRVVGTQSHPAFTHVRNPNLGPYACISTFPLSHLLSFLLCVKQVNTFELSHF